jgi:CDP-glycerol glycerophosphotransferase (TagB/SpsB family)
MSSDLTRPVLFYQPNSEETRQLILLFSDEENIISRRIVTNIYNNFFQAFPTQERAYRVLTRDVVLDDQKNIIYKTLTYVYLSQT